MPKTKKKFLFEYKQYYYDGYEMLDPNDDDFIIRDCEKYYYSTTKLLSRTDNIMYNNRYYYKSPEPDELCISMYNCLSNTTSFNSIVYLNLNCCGMKNITRLPKRLIELHCEGNRFTKLPRLPLTLKILNCSRNNIKELPELPKSLTDLNCSNNKNLTILPKLPKLLEKIDFRYTNISKFPDNMLDLLRNKKLMGDNIYYYKTPLHDNMNKYNISNICLYNCGNHIYESAGMGCMFLRATLPCYKSIIRNYIMKIKSISIIENWFLDCKYNPKYKYCRDRLEKQYEELYNDE